eukprot:c16831_g1_i1 orf=25-393(+)
MRRPRNFIESCVLHNIKDNDGDWIPTKFSLYSWVTMQPSMRGPHCVRKKGSGCLDNHWKGRILELCISEKGMGVSKVKIQHVYTYKELSLDPNIQYPSYPTHCMFPYILFSFPILFYISEVL